MQSLGYIMELIPGAAAVELYVKEALEKNRIKKKNI